MTAGDAFFGGELAIARRMRRSCDNCGSEHLDFGSLGGIALVLDGDARKHAIEALELLDSASIAWRCNDCTNFGVFTDWERSF